MAGRPDTRRKWLMVSGSVVCLAGLFVLARIPYFYIHSHVRGSQLLQQAQQEVGPSGNSAPTSAGQSGDPSSGQSVPMTTIQLTRSAPMDTVIGELDIPALGLVAPVLQGTDDRELNVSVGHLKASVVPGQSGTAVLAAHNATWFRHINKLHTGDHVVVKLPGLTVTFAVKSKKIVHTGTPVYNTAGPSLMLEACYPLDALYLTPYRYLVYASLVSTKKTATSNLSGSSASRTSTAGSYFAKVPTTLAKEGLTLSTNSLPMGTLSYTGQPSQAYTQSNQPLSASTALVALYLAWLHGSADKNTADLHSLLPIVNGADTSVNPVFGVPLAQSKSQSQFDVTLQVSGNTLQSAKAVTDVAVGSRGTYVVTLLANASGQQLSVSHIEWKHVT